ncbi:hypothetical protein PHJA_001460700 [Phtheirospermum japonicum]|uniref:Uncharacterized protein n=1 Tax=Phtheirospermum japonicum TaxID=374723 RepID=A0A830C9R1_9LAMI|nr:hypothetical protein PHJA_001460700 [Phtheirospermum japonicum]
MAEDDDDEAFGEFASASFQSNSPFRDGEDSLADNEDDEWGDFVKSPQQSKSSDPSFIGNHEPDNVMSPPKRRSALPLSLSIFGDSEKEEEVVNFGIVGDSNPGISDCSQLTNKSGKDDFSFKPFVPLGPNENGNLFGSLMHEFTGFNSNLKATPSVQKSISDLDMNGQSQQFAGSATAIDDDCDNGWEFKDAFSDFGTEDNKVELRAHEIPERSAYSFGIESGSKKPLDLFGTSNGSLNYFATSTDSVGYVATSSGISSTFQEVGFISNRPTNGFISETNSYVEQNNIKGLLNYSTNDGSEELNEDFGEFTAASAEIGSKPEEFSANGVFFANDAVSTPNGKTQVK